ncbi:hypothetical protein LMG29542_08399 [Paraburkholderia humisilvae]|uniref:Uncharacterized protein n=1 Tax=Paraburkholderia humisilvae TaxID=627669 RepID=A0A6J5FC37_9BURK|nr:hypothetical protein LMG29542_08399 [Paraburkholderia humisilvae]
MPEDIQDGFGYAIHLAQAGDKHDDAKPRKGFGAAGALEVVSRTARVLTAQSMPGKSQTLCMCCNAFRRSRPAGSPPRNMDLIRARLKAAEALAKGEPK